MRILYIITGLRHGGAERGLNSTCQHLLNTYHVHIEVIYFDPYAPLAALFARYGIQVHLMKRDCFLLPKLISFIIRGRFDIIHTHLIHADIIGRLAAFMTVHRHLTAVFSTAHGIEWFRKRKSIYCAIIRLLDRCLAVPDRSRVVAISQSVYDHLVNEQRLPAAKVFLLYNAIEIPDQHILPGVKTPCDDFKLLFVGRLAPEKNLPCLLKALLLLVDKPVSLTIVGEGRMADELKQLSRSYGLNSRITFAGATLNPQEYYATHDALVLPSSSEGLGGVILEAFSHHMPVIGSEVEGICELLQSGRGLLFPNNDHQRLADQILLLSANRSLCESLGEAGYNYLVENHDIRAYVRQLYQMYSDSLTR